MQPSRNVFRADRASYRRLEEKEAAGEEVGLGRLRGGGTGAEMAWLV